MKAEATIVPGKLLHCMRLGDSLRAEDRAELEALGRPDPHYALVECLQASDVVFAAVVEGEVAAMFGCSPVTEAPTGVGCVWFLTGSAFAAHPRAFVRIARSVMKQLLERYPVLVNFIDARYSAAVRWAKWLGFDVKAPVPYGPAGMLFHPARLEAH